MAIPQLKTGTAKKVLSDAGFTVSVEGDDVEGAAKMEATLVDFLHRTPPGQRGDVLRHLAAELEKNPTAKVRITDPETELKTEAEREAAQKIADVLNPLPPHQRAETIQGAQKRLAELDTEHAVLSKNVDALRDLREWISAGNLTLAQPQGSAWYKLREAWKRNAVLNGTTDERNQSKYFESEPHVVVVEHDWAKAFGGCGDFDAGEFHLPFPRCCFEFQMGGRRVMAMLLEDEVEVTLRPYIQSRGTWISGLEYVHNDGIWHSHEGICDESESIALEISRQVRAVSIALEADAVEQDEQVQSEKVNAHRVKQGKPPFNSFHTIRIAAHRRMKREAREGDAKWHVRLHFRRGHWRHYANHKTWIKWMIVGDPDLGFVNKHYRL